MTLDDLLARRETVDFEAKLAGAADGRGEVPRSFWETYAAMANTQGGEIVLGLKERPDGSFDVRGIDALHRVRKQFWDEINNPKTVSANLLQDDDLTVVGWNAARSVLHVLVPRADRRRRPVYVGENPLTGTFRRNYEGDYRCSPDEARRLIADAERDTLDDDILTGYTVDDLDPGSLASYRNEFRSAKPSHAWLTEDDRGLLTQLGGWRRDRQSEHEGLTLAGLLMFGRFRPIHDALTHYVVDYRDVSDVGPDQRWGDRVTTDGTWPGNLYGFYRRAYARLTEDLRVPFRTESSQRIDETNVHRALKEALVNALIHADYSGTTPILVQKERGGFSFRNPGTLRLPRELTLAGGVSDCRNRSLQKMFQMLGAAEQAGSGFPTIRRAWREQHWRPLTLKESAEPDTVTLRLSTASLFPGPVLEDLHGQFGDSFAQLTESERVAVVTAAAEGQVSNPRLQEILDDHQADITRMLGRLVGGGFLVQHGKNRWAYYTLPRLAEATGTLFPTPDTDQTPPDTDHILSPRLLPYAQAVGDVRETKWAVPERTETGMLAVLRLARDRDEYLSVDDLSAILRRSRVSVYRYLRQLGDAVETRFPDRQARGQGYRAA